MACYIVGDSMMNKSAHFRKTVSATTDPPTAIPVSLFLVSTDRDARRDVAAGGVVINLMNRARLARLQKLPQRLIPNLTGFLPGAKLTA